MTSIISPSGSEFPSIKRLKRPKVIRPFRKRNVEYPFHKAFRILKIARDAIKAKDYFGAAHVLYFLNLKLRNKANYVLDVTSDEWLHDCWQELHSSFFSEPEKIVIAFKTVPLEGKKLNEVYFRLFVMNKLTNINKEEIRKFVDEYKEVLKTKINQLILEEIEEGIKKLDQALVDKELLQADALLCLIKEKSNAAVNFEVIHKINDLEEKLKELILNVLTKMYNELFFTDLDLALKTLLNFKKLKVVCQTSLVIKVEYLEHIFKKFKELKPGLDTVSHKITCLCSALENSGDIFLIGYFFSFLQTSQINDRLTKAEKDLILNFLNSTNPQESGPD